MRLRDYRIVHLPLSLVLGSLKMTVQVSEVLNNECSDISFEDYQLFGGCVQDPSTNAKWIPYPFKEKGNPDMYVAASNCWRGYVSTYKLHNSGNISLIKIEYPNKDNSEGVNEQLLGSFWLEFRKGFFGEKAFVPFIDGKIEKDKSKWVVHGRT